MAIFLRTSDNAYNSLFDHEMVIWWSDVDVPVLDRLAVNWMEGVQRPGPVENVGQHAWTLRGDMQNEEDSSREAHRQRTDQFYKSFYAASRRSNHDHIMSRHNSTLPHRSLPRQHVSLLESQASGQENRSLRQYALL